LGDQSKGGAIRICGLLDDAGIRDCHEDSLKFFRQGVVKRKC